MTMASSKSVAGGGGTAGAPPPDKPTPSPTQYFSLRWNNHSLNLVSRFTGLYQSETLTDVTLAAEGKHLQAHKMLLSACSDYFQSLFSINPCQHPIVILKDVTFEDLQIVVQFMYNGIVNVSSEKLPDILKTAETLQIKGLAEKFTESLQQSSSSHRRAPFISSSSFASSRHLSVPSVGSRQLSTESLPEYIHRTHSPRMASFESRQYSLESTGNPSSSTTKRHANSPPLSPTRMQFRKKFRRMSGCGSSSERGNSVEDDRSPGVMTSRSSPPPTIHLSPTRQSSSSTDGGGGQTNNSSSGTTVAKKKRELFSARSSRSGGSNKSSEASIDYQSSSSKLQDSGSSNETRQGSISHTSVDDTGNVTTINLQSSLAVPSRPRTSLGRAQSAGEAATPTDLSMDAKSPGSDVSNSNGSNRRNRFTLKRQDCLERGCEGELDLTITPTNVRSTPASPYSQNLGSPPAAHEHAPLVSDPPLTSSILTTPSFSLDSNPDPGFIGESLSPAPPPPPPLAHRLPSVRVIPDAVDPLSLEESSNCMNYGLLHPNFRASLEYPTPLMPRPPPVKPFNPPPNLVDYYSSPPSAAVTSSATIYSGGGPVAPPHVSEAPPTVSNATNSSSMTVTEQFGHCPKEREGPALGCNYCWNTTDVNGRILRRKTKYHCPDCQANLCIVPCFQAYHENLDRDKNSGNGGDHKA